MRFQRSVHQIQLVSDLRKRCLPKPNIRFIFNDARLGYPCHIPCHQDEPSGGKGRHVCSVPLWGGLWAPLRENRGRGSLTWRQPPPSLPASGLKSEAFSSATGHCSCPLDEAYLQLRVVSSVHGQYTHCCLSPDLLFGVRLRSPTSLSSYTLHS